MQSPYADRSLMPDFPGLAKAESTENWDAGFPIQMSKIRPKDEKYWKDFRGTPKAFVGRRPRGNRQPPEAARFPGHRRGMVRDRMTSSAASPVLR